MIHFNMDHFFHSKIFAVDLFCNSNLKNVLQVELTGEFLYLLSDCLKNLINCAQNSYDLAICPYFLLLDLFLTGIKTYAAIGSRD
jgi:hypothetical protein